MAKKSTKKKLKSQIPLQKFFQPSEGDPEEVLQWHLVNCQILNAKGTPIFEQKNVEAPVFWSSHAVEIAASKYFRKTGVGSKGYETSIRQMVRRVSQAIADSGCEQGYFDRKDSEVFEAELRTLLLTQRGFFNSPVWFNLGLSRSYGIKSQSPCWAWSKTKKKAVLQQDAYLRPQISACFIQKVEDNLESIFDLAKNEARLFKYGSGSGTNFSNLRSKYEKLEGGGTSSGVIAFLEVLDRGAGSVKSGGTTRRAAKMVLLDIDHPEIEDFISWKEKEEKKAQALSLAGYGNGFESEAYRSVSGQNSNNSVRLTDKFMRAIEKNQDWELKSRTTKRTIKSLPARELWQQIAQAAWTCADPGVQFHDTIQKWNTARQSGVIRASNPCSEFLFLDDSACNLASLNLIRFLGADGEFDILGFLQATRVFFLAQEILIDEGSYPTEAIAKNSHWHRPVGLGMAGLGAFCMRKGIAYDSDTGRAWAGALAALLTGAAYEWSTQISRVIGPSEGFKINKKSHLKVMREHKKALSKISWDLLPSELEELSKTLWTQVLLQGAKWGMRNAQATVMAPTGTIGLVMDSETTGIEPEFSLLKTKKFSGGGVRSSLSRSLSVGLRTLGYSTEKIQSAELYVQIHGTLVGCSEIQVEHLPIFATAMEISPLGHVTMMQALQPFVSGAISKTVNLAKNVSPQKIQELYFSAWKKGLKSLAIYRDHSKGSQPLERLEESGFPKCFECQSPTELVGACFRCVNCGTVIGCA